MISIRERKTALLDGWNEGVGVWSDVVIDMYFWLFVCLLVLHKKKKVKIEKTYVILSACIVKQGYVY